MTEEATIISLLSPYFCDDLLKIIIEYTKTQCTVCKRIIEDPELGFSCNKCKNGPTCCPCMFFVYCENCDSTICFKCVDFYGYICPCCNTQYS